MKIDAPIEVVTVEASRLPPLWLLAALLAAAVFYLRK